MRRGTEHAGARIARVGILALLASIGVALGGGGAVAQGTLPNIVYILADDMGIGDVRSYTPTSPVNTPNIDRIATAGMRFTDAHSSDSICSPTRYSLLTGQYAFRSTYLQSGVVLPYGPAMIDPSRLTVAEMLKASGYSTGAFGKWHVGMNWVTTNGAASAQNGSNVNHSQPFTGGPVDNGFDTYFGVDAANYPPYAFIRDRQTVGSDLTTPTSPTGQVYGNPSNLSSNRIGPIVPGYNITDALPTVTNQAAAYISLKANQANPFFAYMPLTAPHEPIVPPAAQVGSTGQGPYGDFIAAVDWSVGRVLDTLADPDNNPNTNDSVLDNTIVVFTADNGAETLFSFPSSPGAVNGVPLRQDKASIYEGGHRIPFVAQWNGHIPAGTVNNHLIELNDLMATAADIVDYNLPTNAAEDSINILPELLGGSGGPSRPIGVAHSSNGAFSIRQLDTAGNEWKLIFTAGDGDYGDNQKFDPKNPLTDFTKVQLYNLTSDPGEQSNLLSGGGTAPMQQKALQLQEMMQDNLYAGRSSNIPPRNIVNGQSTMLVDFGINGQQTTATGWNNLAGATFNDPSFAKGLYDDGGGYTGIIIKSQFVNPSSSTGVSQAALNYDGPYPAGLAGIPDSALKDGFYVADGDKLVITLESLDAHATYDFLFYSAAKSESDYTLFTATGDTTQQAHIAPVVNNATQVAMINGIMADALKKIRIDVEGRRPDGSLQNPSVSFDGRGQINFLRIIEHLLELPGDFNNDRIVDAADYAAWRSAFGTVGTSFADGNHDGVVDAGDYVIWRKAMSLAGAGSSAGAGFGQLAIPEPVAAQLVGVAVVTVYGIAARRRRQARRQPPELLG